MGGWCAGGMMRNGGDAHGEMLRNGGGAQGGAQWRIMRNRDGMGGFYCCNMGTFP